MAQTLKFGKGTWATKTGSSMAYNDQNGNYKPLPFNVERDSIATRVNKQGLIEVVGKDKLRIDYTDSAKGVALLEPSRTNLITYSEDFSESTWVKQSSGVASAPIVSNNYAISPDGTLNADRVVFDINGGTTSSDFSQIADAITNSIGDVTNSVWIKSNTTSNYNMSFVDPNANYTSIVVTTEWQRFDVTSTTVSTASAFRLRLRGSEATSDYADVSVWGGQVEQGSYATSYIPTSGSTVQRQADVVNGSGNSEVFNSQEGVLFAEISALANDGTSRRIAISDGTNSNRLFLGYTSVSNELIAVNISNNATSVLISNSISVLQSNKIAFKYKQNDFALWVNGVKVGVDTLANTPIGINTLRFEDGNGTNDFYGNTKEIGYYDEILTDAELEYMTSYRSLNEMVTELNLNAL